MPVLCGNHQAHGTDRVYHPDSDTVRMCFNPPPSVPEPEPEVCEHQMSASLCAGPDHYPADDPNSPFEHMTLPELMSATSNDYHRRGENCPWDCAHCPGNIAADEAERAHYAEQETARAADTSTSTHAPYDGVYVIENPPSGLPHRTFRLNTQGLDQQFAPGKQIIGYLSGPDNERDYTNFGFVDRNALGYFVRLWKSFRGREHDGLMRDVEMLLRDSDSFLTEAHCFRCSRRLTVPASVYAGYGPECAKKV